MLKSASAVQLSIRTVRFWAHHSSATLLPEFIALIMIMGTAVDTRTNRDEKARREESENFRNVQQTQGGNIGVPHKFTHESEAESRLK